MSDRPGMGTYTGYTPDPESSDWYAARRLPLRVLAAVRPRPARLRDRPFWWTQLLVALGILAVYGTDHFVHGEIMEGGIHDLPVMLFIVPVMYAALVYGFEGAVLTAVWSALLAAPHTWFVSHENFEWLGDLGTMSIIMVAGIFLAFRTEREREARQRAEAGSERMRLLNDLGGVLDRSADLPRMLQELTDTLRSGLQLDLLWVRYARGGETDLTVLVSSGDAGPLSSGNALAIAAIAATESVQAGHGATGGQTGWVVVPMISEQRFMGAMGAGRSSPPISNEERDVLAAAAAQASVKLENQALQRERREALMSYARRVTVAQEDERRRIARELHDGATQALTGLCRGMDVLRAEHGRDGDQQHVATLESLRGEAERALVDLRRLTRDLRPAVIEDLGLVSALEWLASDLEERSGITVQVATSGTPSGLSSDQEVGLFRIVQEALSNVEKHAEAERVELTLDCHDSTVIVRVRDDGKGFEVPAELAALARLGRYGLLGMQERAALTDGTLAVESAPGEGTTLTVEIRAAQAVPAEPRAQSPAF